MLKLMVWLGGERVTFGKRVAVTEGERARGTI